MLAKHAKVMLIDGSEPIRNLMAQHLARAGCVTVNATNSEHAWLMLMNDIPDLVLLDYQTPALDGGDLVERIRRSRLQKLSSVPIVAVTTSEEWARLLSLAGASATLMKPFKGEELIATVRRFVTCEPC